MTIDDLKRMERARKADGDFLWLRYKGELGAMLGCDSKEGAVIVRPINPHQPHGDRWPADQVTVDKSA